MRMALLLVSMFVVYVAALPASSQGYGYPGHGGYHRRGSFFYWGGLPTYHTPSHREGSLGGPGHRGGGPRGGK